MNRWLRSCATALLLLISATAASAERFVVIVEGLGGEPRFSEAFAEQVAIIEEASRSLLPADNLKVFRVGDARREAILAAFADVAAASDSDDELVVYFIGHGSFDDVHYKFNLPGPDLSDEDIVALFDEQPAATQVFINSSSASGALAEMLAAEQRLLVLATRSGRERHATRFGGYFATALNDEAADTNKSGSVSVAEAFAFAERQVADFYERNNQLATEHPELSGTRAERITLARFGDEAPESTDEELAAMLGERQAMNADIDALRLRRDEMPADDYQAALLESMLALAALEERIELREQAVQDAN